jgi:hypothetical protein
MRSPHSTWRCHLARAQIVTVSRRASRSGHDCRGRCPDLAHLAHQRFHSPSTRDAIRPAEPSLSRRPAHVVGGHGYAPRLSWKLVPCGRTGRGWREAGPVWAPGGAFWTGVGKLPFVVRAGSVLLARRRGVVDALHLLDAWDSCPARHPADVLIQLTQKRQT